MPGLMKSRLRHALLLGCAVVCAHAVPFVPSAAYAQAATREFKIPAQSLADALRAFANQTGRDVLFAPAVVAGKTSPGVRGALNETAALQILLYGTGLTFQVTSTNGYAVLAQNAAAAAGPPKGTAPETLPTAKSTVEKSTADTAIGDKSESVEKVTVTGTRLKRAGAGTFPVDVYTKDDIDRSGQTSLGEFLSTLPEVSVNSPITDAVRFGAQTVPQLRGLPAGTTLILINGRRVQSSGGSASGFFDLNLIPFAAIERVEILPVGSSAVYGGDALAGVINVVLKTSANESAFDMRYGVADGTDDKSASLFFSRDFERGSLSIIGAHSQRSPLSASDRAFFRDADYRRFGGTDQRTQSCTPGNVSSTTAANLPGLTSTIAGIPSIAPGQPVTIASFSATAGVPNLCAARVQGYGSPLSLESASTSAHAAADYRIVGSVSLFGELTYSDSESETFLTNLALTNVLVPATNPFNPFGTAVRVNTRLGVENGDNGTLLESEYLRSLVGARGDLADQWEFEAVVFQTRDDTVAISKNNANVAARTAALASSDPATALNPFATGLAASEAVLRGIWSNRVQSTEGVKDVFNAFVRGPLFVLPAGALDVVIGVEAGRDQWTSRPMAPQVPYDLSRTYRSIFAEARIPLLAALSGAADAPDFATLTVAGRRDDYSDFGDASTYQVGLEVRPLDGMLLRYGTATSFRTPTLFQLGAANSVFTTEQLLLRDPRNGNAPIVGGVVNFGANPDLQPENGEAQTVSLMWDPSFAPGLRFGATAWQIDIQDFIFLPSGPQFILDNEALFPSYVTRGPGAPGQVTQVFWSYVNFGKFEVAGVDFDASYSFENTWGDWNVAASATQTITYDVAVTPGAPVQSRLSKLFTDAWAPEWKGQFSVGFDTGPWSLGVTGRYIGAYQDAGASVRELGGIMFLDLSGRIDLGELLSDNTGLLRGSSLSAGLVNVTDELPEFANTTANYDFTQSDWRGRYFTIRLSVVR